MDRALRRFYEARWKHRAYKRIRQRQVWSYWAGGEPDSIDEAAVGIEATTRTLCSRYCCGNPRKFWKSEKRTFQEKKQFDSFKDQLDNL